MKVDVPAVPVSVMIWVAAVDAAAIVRVVPSTTDIFVMVPSPASIGAAGTVVSVRISLPPLPVFLPVNAAY